MRVTDGPALVRLGQCGGRIEEFYIVFHDGIPSPTRFSSYGAAEKAWRHAVGVAARAAFLRAELHV